MKKANYENDELMFKGFRLLSYDKDGNAHLTKSASDFIVNQTDIVNRINDDFKAMKELLMKHLSMHEIKKISDGLVTITMVAETIRNILDSDRFKEEHPDLYKEYLTESTSKAYVKISVEHSKKS